jgi:hypothetical protein
MYILKKHEHNFTIKQHLKLFNKFIYFDNNINEIKKNKKNLIIK